MIKCLKHKHSFGFLSPSLQTRNRDPSMARISSFPSFNHAKKHRNYNTTASTDAATASTPLCYNRNKDHNHTISHVVQSLTRSCHTRRHLFQLQSHFISSGLFRHPFPASHILKLSSELAHIDHTILVFQHMHSPDAYCINTVLKAYSSHPHLAHGFYFRMLAKGFRPNSHTFPPLLVSLANSLSTQAGFICHAHSIKYGVQSVLPVQNSLIHMYATFGLMDSAFQMFDTMSDRDVVSWNSIVQGYIRLGNVGAAHGVFDKMPTRNAVSWNIMISGYLKSARNPGCGLKLFRNMMKLGFKCTDTTFVVVLTACGRSARLKEGKSVHGALIKNLVKKSLIIETSLIEMYSKCLRVEAARRVFDSMLVRNLVCWNAMVLGYCIHGFPKDGIALFHKMIGQMDPDNDGGGSKERGGTNNGQRSSLAAQIVTPDEITFVGILCACARRGLLSDGRSYFNQMLHVYNIKPNFAHYWCMANLYYGVGLIQEAEEVLRSMPEVDGNTSDSLVWSSLLGSCRFRGDIELGERIAMRLIEIEPQNVSHHSLLFNIYAVAGRWEEAAKVKRTMEEKGVVKMLDCSLVDLNETVHEFEVRDRSQPGMDDVYSMLDGLVRKLWLPKNRFATTITPYMK